MQGQREELQMLSKKWQRYALVHLVFISAAHAVAPAKDITAWDEAWLHAAWPIPAPAAKSTVWQEVGNADWDARTEAAALAFKGRLWLIGGRTIGPMGDVWSSADGKRWREETPLGFPPRVDCGAVVFAGKMWVMGGQDITGARNDVYSSADGITWTQVTASAAWEARYRFGLVVHGNAMYLFGGNGKVNTDLNDVWYSTNGADWFTATLSADWSPRNGFGTVEFNNLIWVFGGFEGGTYYRDIWFSYNGVSWAKATDAAAWNSCWLSGIAPFDNKLWLVGNYAESQDVYSSTDAINWTREATPPWPGRHSHSLAVLNDRLWLLGGTTVSGDTNEVWALPAEGKLGAACGCAEGNRANYAGDFLVLFITCTFLTVALRNAPVPRSQARV